MTKKKKAVDKNKMADARIAEINRENQIRLEGAAQAATVIDQAAKMFHKAKTKRGIHDKYASEMLFDGMIYVMADLMAHGYTEKYFADPVEEVKKFAIMLHNRTADIIQLRNGDSEIITAPNGTRK